MLKIGTIYRTPSPPQKEIAEVDGLPNFYYESNTPNIGFSFQRGIHNVKIITGPNGESRCPLIIISSTPRKSGSKDTPWHNKFDPDHGYIKYYGDNKTTNTSPEKSKGNEILLNLLKYYDSPNKDDRMNNAVPIIFFERCSYDGREKGNIKFQGFGILESAELVTQYDSKHSYFANYLFNFCVLSLSEDNEQFDWRWISDRCDPSKNIEDTLKYAPSSWKRWIQEGKTNLHLLRRNISGKGLLSEANQAPSNKKMLDDIYHYYDNRKVEFEYLAMEITIKTIEESGATCVPGWITKKSGDGGVDYILRVDIGNELLSSVKIIVLGQAKCTIPSKPTNGRDIARTVARLKRGWIGAFVTTSYFSQPVQQEVNEDSYPLIMINGKKIVEIVEQELFKTKKTLTEYLDSLKTKYSEQIRIPEDILEI